MHRSRVITGALNDDMPEAAVAIIGDVRHAVGGWATYAAGQWAGAMDGTMGGAADGTTGGAAGEVTGGGGWAPGTNVVYADDVAAALLRSRVGGAGGRALTAGAERLAAALARYEDVAGADDGGALVAPRLTADGLRAWVEDVAGSGVASAAGPVAAVARSSAADIVARAAGFGAEKPPPASSDRQCIIRGLPALPALSAGRELAARSQLRRAAALAAPASQAIAAVDKAIATWNAAASCGCPLIAFKAASEAELALAAATEPGQVAASDRELGELVAAAAAAAAEARAVAGDITAADIPAPPTPADDGLADGPEPEPAMLADGTSVARLALAAAPRAERGAAFQAAVATYLDGLAAVVDAATRQIAAMNVPKGQLKPKSATSNTSNKRKCNQ
jgi:hypothetical protein